MYKSPLYKPLCTAALAGALCLGGALTASAAESVIEMQAIRDKGPGPVIGTVHAADAGDGLVLEFDLSDLPPGPNRLYLHDAGDCALPRGELLSSAPLAVVNVDINEDGAEPLKKTVVVPGTTLAEMSQKALVIYRGGQSADLGPEQTGLKRLVACGIVR